MMLPPFNPWFNTLIQGLVTRGTAKLRGWLEERRLTATRPPIAVTVGIYPPERITFWSSNGKFFYYFVNGRTVSLDDFPPRIRKRFRPALQRQWQTKRLAEQAQKMEVDIR